MTDQAWWASDIADLANRLGSGAGGLGSAEAGLRVQGHARRSRKGQTFRLFLSQFTTPLVLILIVGVVLSLFLREWIDATIILFIILGSGLLGFTQEYAASRAIEELRQRLVRQVRLLRDGREVRVPLDDVVAGDVALLRPDLGAIRRGVEDGRRTFANTLKYVAITISANFGNMISMALAKVFLPFLPLLPVQILLNNFLSSLPAIAIASDAVDRERVAAAQRWDIRRIRNFMIVFGFISTVFDLLTFAFFRLVMRVDPDTFRTGWFVLSLLTELAALMVLRTRRRFWRSPPSRLLLWSTVLVAALALALPYSGGIADLFSFRPLAPVLVVQLLALVGAYAVVTEFAKRRHGIHGR